MDPELINDRMAKAHDAFHAEIDALWKAADIPGKVHLLHVWQDQRDADAVSWAASSERLNKLMSAR